MFNIFEYDFMQRAFIAGALIAIVLPCIGQLVLIKRLSMIGDTLSHSSLACLLYTSDAADDSTEV